MQFFLDLLIVFLLILLSGVFAATELALVSLRDSQVQKLANESKKGEKVATLAKDPNRFLSAAQIGVTFIGFFSASYGAATMTPYVKPYLFNNDVISLVVLTIFISYLSLVFGELVPKRLAIQKTEQIALAISPPLDVFAKLMKPVIFLLSISTNTIFKLLGGDPKKSGGEEISEEELQNIVETHDTLEDDEKQILSDVIQAGNRSISEVMRPRADVVFISSELPLAEAAKFVQEQPYSRYPVIKEDFDDIIGFVHVRDLLDKTRLKKFKFVKDVTRNILKLPSTNQLFPSLTTMRAKGVHIAIVLDEYGGTDGIVTLEDMIEELIGEIHDEYDVRETKEVRQDKDGSFSVDGGIKLDDFEDATSIKLEDGPYETVAGYVIARIGQLPTLGDSVKIYETQIDDTDSKENVEKATLTVSKIEGMRIARVKVRLNDKE